MTISAMTQGMTGAVQSSVETTAFCLTSTTSLVDSCLRVLASVKTGSNSIAEHTASSVVEATEAQRSTPYRGPAGKLLKMAFSVSGAGCGIAAGLYKACL